MDARWEAFTRERVRLDWHSAAYEVALCPNCVEEFERRTGRKPEVAPTMVRPTREPHVTLPVQA
jgi:hypothetical protein